MRNAVILLALALAAPGLAVTDWIQTNAGTHSWTNSANWSPAVVPNAASEIVTITNALEGNQIIIVTQTNTTLGELIVGNTNSITITNLTGGTFRFDNGATNPRIEIKFGAAIYVPVVFGSGTGLEITNAVSLSAYGALGGFSNLVKRGAGTISIGAINTFTGDMILQNGGSVYVFPGQIPTTTVVQVEGGSICGLYTATIKGARGIGTVANWYSPGNGKVIIGTNTAAATAYGYTWLVGGGFLDPGLGTNVGSLSLAGGNGCVAYIQGGDVYIDLVSSNSFDKIGFTTGVTRTNQISGGNLHLNFMPGYTPTNGARWDIISGTGLIFDTNGPPLFDRIDSNFSVFNYTAEIITTNKVRVTTVPWRGTIFGIH